MSIIDNFEAADLFLLAACVAHLVDLKVDHLEDLNLEVIRLELKVKVPYQSY